MPSINSVYENDEENIVLLIIIGVFLIFINIVDLNKKFKKDKK